MNMVEFELNKNNRSYLEESCKKYADELVTMYSKLAFDNHCYMRMAYDLAIENKWDNVVQKPFYKNATDEQLQKAIGNMVLMSFDLDFVHKFNRKSLKYRGKLKIE